MNYELHWYKNWLTELHPRALWPYLTEKGCVRRGYPVTSTSIQSSLSVSPTFSSISCQRSCFLRYLGWQESWSPGQYLRLKNLGGPVFRPGPVRCFSSECLCHVHIWLKETELAWYSLLYIMHSITCECSRQCTSLHYIMYCSTPSVKKALS